MKLCLFVFMLLCSYYYFSNDRIQGLAILQQPTWINQESKIERLNFDKPRW